MTDPVSLVALGAAVGGAAGKLVENAWDLGQNWIRTYFKDHRPQAVEAAEQNAAMFLADLAQRVHTVETRLAAEPGGSERVRDALEDPDFAATLQDALLASARTSSEDKHDILARAVADRLSVDGESIRALASALAIKAIPHLSKSQLHLLAVANLVYGIRPGWVSRFEVRPDAQNTYDNWLISALSPSISIVSVSQLDYLHLVSVNCITYEPFMGRELKDVLAPVRDKPLWDAAGFLGTSVGTRLSEIWKDGLQSINLTPTGRLVGIYTHDALTETTTEIGW